LETPNEAYVNSIIWPGWKPTPDEKKRIDEYWGSFLTVKSKDPITNKLVLDEAYDEALGLNDVDSISPVALVCMKRCTELHKGHLFEEVAANFMRYDIYEKTGLDLMSFLNLPTYRVLAIKRALTKVRKEEPTIPKSLSKKFTGI